MSYILCPEENLEEGHVFTIKTDEYITVLMFEDSDDAHRYAEFLKLENENFTPIEIEKEVAIEMCEMYGYSYTVAKPNDLLLPILTDDSI